MSKEIQRTLKHILDVAQKSIENKLPLVSKVIMAINKWLWSIDFKEILKLKGVERQKYDNEKVEELSNKINNIKSIPPEEIIKGKQTG